MLSQDTSPVKVSLKNIFMLIFILSTAKTTGKVSPAVDNSLLAEKSFSIS